MKNPIIIMGCRRSGTTLLNTVLDQHPDIHAHPKELQIINDLARLYGVRLPNTEQAIEYACGHEFCPFNVTISRLRHALNGAPSCTLHEFIYAYLQTWHGEDPRRIVLKYPRFVFQLPLLHQIFPKATYIHVVRDPRANVSSQVARWPRLTIWEGARYWQDSVTAAQKWRQRFPDRMIELQYGSLIQKPEQTLRSICQQLNVSFTPELLSFEMETRRFTPGKAPELTRYKGITSQRLNLWRERLNSVEIRLIEEVCAPLMETYGYKLDHPPVNERTLRKTRWQQKSHFWILANGRWLKNRGRGLRRFWRQHFSN